MVSAESENAAPALTIGVAVEFVPAELALALDVTLVNAVGRMVKLSVEQVIEEPEPVSIDNILEISEQMKEMILGFIEKYDKMTPEELVEQRYQRFRKF